MTDSRNIEEVPAEVDLDSLKYVADIGENGFRSTASVSYLTEEDLSHLPEGPYRLHNFYHFYAFLNLYVYVDKYLKSLLKRLWINKDYVPTYLANRFFKFPHFFMTFYWPV